MTRYYDSTGCYIVADPDKVLCDGLNMTAPGGRVSSNRLSKWAEMSVEEAEALIAANTEDATEADYIAALAELGVEIDEEV